MKKNSHIKTAISVDIRLGHTGVIVLHRITSSLEMGSQKKVLVSPGGPLWRELRSRPSGQLLLWISVQKGVEKGRVRGTF